MKECPDIPDFLRVPADYKPKGRVILIDQPAPDVVRSELRSPRDQEALDEIERVRKIKTANRIAKMLAKKKSEEHRKAGHRFDTKSGFWVDSQGRRVG